MDRQKATRQIERIVDAIEGEKFPAKVRELHVFGSYAHGALNPDDLDLILIHDPAPELLEHLEAELVKKYGKDFTYWPRGQRKFESMMRRVMRRPGEKMDILLGTSIERIVEMGESIANAHRILIWSDSDRSWRLKLDSIRPDSNAGRDERAHFANLKRFRSDLRTMVNVTEAVSQGFLKLTRIDAEKVEPNLNRLYQYWYDWWVQCKVMGRNSMKLLRHGMWWVQEQRGQARRRPDPPEHDGVMYSEDRKYVVYFGNPPLHAVYRVCHGDHRHVRACLIPHFKTGEPSEMFVFEQGERTNQMELEQIMHRG
ncbi:MAG TPA: nucleotidyltransferase domain-containing protein [Pirellulales bacterium]|nr:nucleotidyltransferase domain-containing protein [Pirellulales bacterium]